MADPTIDLVEPMPVDPARKHPQAPPPQRSTELSVIQYAVQSGASVAELKAMMELQVQADNHQLAMMREKRRMDEEDRARAALLAFRRDFAAFRGENVIVPKSKYVDRGKAGIFMQAEYHVASNLLSPALSRHGFGFRHNEVFGAKRWMNDGVESDVPWVYVTCYLEHRDGHAETLDLEGPPGDMTANTPVQNMQVTGTYLKRQSLLAITGTATGGEDDENQMRRRPGGKPDRDAEQPEPTAAQIAEAEAKVKLGAEAFAKWWNVLPREVRDVYGKERRDAWLAEAKKVSAPKEDAPEASR